VVWKYEGEEEGRRYEGGKITHHQIKYEKGMKNVTVNEGSLIDKDSGITIDLSETDTPETCKHQMRRQALQRCDDKDRTVERNALRIHIFPL